MDVAWMWRLESAVGYGLQSAWQKAEHDSTCKRWHDSDPGCHSACMQAEEEAAQTAASLAAFPVDTAPAQQPGTQLQLQPDRYSTAAQLHTTAHQQTAATTLSADGRTYPQIGQLGPQPGCSASGRYVESQPVAVPASVQGRASDVDAIAAPQAAVQEPQQAAQAAQSSVTETAAAAPGPKDGSNRPGVCR